MDGGNGYQKVKNLLGPSEYVINFSLFICCIKGLTYGRVVWLDPREAAKVRHQISDILGSLSRDDIFPLFEENPGSVGALALRDQIDPSTN